MIGEFGKLLRKIRIDAGEVMQDMAEKLLVSAAYLSAVETTKRPVPAGWPEKIRDLYDLNESLYRTLCDARDQDAKSVVIGINGADQGKQRLAMSFAREFNTLQSVDVEKMMKILMRGR